jgi:hypothetical protein
VPSRADWKLNKVERLKGRERMPPNTPNGSFPVARITARSC